ncbi:hypothetical protein OIO90_003762 [Microbotryomycetes sp. JL221]|nr:hypothetical protein OIO90_003762 [Microbotryomycetes sp. JL221]
MQGGGNGAVHMRRRSSRISPNPNNGEGFDQQQHRQSVYGGTTRTPKLEQGHQFEPYSTSSRGRRPTLPAGIGAGSRSRAGINTTYLTRLAGYVLRLLSSPRGLITLGSVTMLWLMTSYISEHADQLASRPVPPILLPIVRQGGTLVDRISPHYGGRIKNWHDYQVANNPNRQLTPEEIEMQSRHTFHPNGLLLVNPKGRHPISVLIEDAESKWRRKLEKQSRTLQEAVQEYKQRYRRNPPKGFDKWWDFAERHDIQLRDEYDQIAYDLAPHWALEAHDSRHRNRVMQDREHTFTAEMTPGHKRVGLHGQHRDLKRATDIRDLLEMFAQDLPFNLNFTFIIDDNPAVMMPYSQRIRMVELAEQGEYYGPSEFVEPHDPELSYFAQACSPNSPLRRSELGHNVQDFSGDARRSFIWDHAKAIDLCQHPEQRRLHGHLMQEGVPFSPLVPLLTFAKTRMHADILATPLEQYSDTYVGYEPPWEQKSHNKLLWRGSTTGVEFDKHTPWRQSQRARLHFLSQNMDGEKPVIFSQGSAVKEANLSIAEMNHLYMDMAFSGEPAQCDPETCEVMRKDIRFKSLIGLEDSNQYKYLIDVDGNGWSGRFHRLMSMKAMILNLVSRSTAFPEWYQDRIQPWVHYVPVKIDYSDLYDIMTYFIGTPDGQGGHDSVAERIGEAGRLWAKNYWRKADMAAYMYRLSLEYSRILHHDEDDVDFVPDITFD